MNSTVKTPIRVTRAASLLERVTRDGNSGGRNLEGVVEYALDQLVMEHSKAYAGRPIEDRSEGVGDMAIWDGDKLRAVVRILPAGSTDVVWFDREGSSRGDGVRYGVFLSTVRDEADRIEGFGMTLDRAIARVVEDFERCQVDAISDGSHDASSFASTWSDVTIWDGDRVAAFLRARPDGTLAVERRDGGEPHK
jgi:hypothetical protein